MAYSDLIENEDINKPRVRGSCTMMIGCPVFVFDIDDTALVARYALADTLMDFTGQFTNTEDWDDYDLGRNFDGYTWEDLLVHLTSCDYMLKCTVDAATVPLLTFLSARGHVALVTSRGFHPDAIVHTERNLAELGVPYDSLHVLPFDVPKHAYIKDVWGTVDLVVEDSQTQLDGIHAAGVSKRTVRLERPWNIKHPFHESYPSLDAFAQKLIAEYREGETNAS